MKHLITIAILATCTAAMATGKKPVPAPAPTPVAQAEAIAAAVALAVQKQFQAQAQLQHQNAQAISGGNMQAVNVAAQERDPVATAYSGALTASNGTCLGSASGGVQGAAFGVSLGSTKKDEGCDARYDAATLMSMGQPRAALARLCQREEIAKAIEASGQRCPAPATSTSAPVKTADYAGSDPIVRARLGLGE